MVDFPIYQNKDELIYSIDLITTSIVELHNDYMDTEKIRQLAYVVY